MVRTGLSAPGVLIGTRLLCCGFRGDLVAECALGGNANCGYFVELVCQPGFVHWPSRRTKISLARPLETERMPLVSISYR